MALPSFMYGDPEKIAMSKEARTCKGCVHKTIVWTVAICEKPFNRGGRAEKRCKDYLYEGDAMLQRVKKADVKRDTFVKPDALDYCLDCWSDWMQGDDRDLSASRMRLHGEAVEMDVYDQQRIADQRIGEATGAAIEDLKPVHRWAMYRRCGITTQWNWPNLDFTQVLPAAEDELRKKLLKNIATGHLF